MDKHGDHHVPAPCLEDPAGCDGIVMGAKAGRVEFALAKHVKLDCGIMQMEQALDQRQVDVLTDPGLLAIVERGTHRR